MIASLYGPVVGLLTGLVGFSLVGALLLWALPQLSLNRRNLVCYVWGAMLAALSSLYAYASLSMPLGQDGAGIFTALGFVVVPPIAGSVSGLVGVAILERRDCRRRARARATTGER